MEDWSGCKVGGSQRLKKVGGLQRLECWRIAESGRLENLRESPEAQRSVVSP